MVVVFITLVGLICRKLAARFLSPSFKDQVQTLALGCGIEGLEFGWLPEISLGRPYHIMINRKVSANELGKFAEMMLEMLPKDLAFTVFVPSAKAFERDLKLQVNNSLVGDKMNNTYAIISRVLGFSAVPRTLSSVSVPFGEEISYDSLSGYPLYVSKSLDGMLVVNTVRSERVDLKNGKIVVHIMDGVIMDAEFEQSI
ncbi:hypothetical protein JRO89_XS14G0083200 [Xanthoceras sorbifolium]|uniref:FAS1 domain-containing protein n=1 Tax=Xanthoceras sorbifolium TaxID=99658 RepID=A0ABQ8H4H7_9ROSI|nr:hypothetical protein JRO89_XS14G0083200 [Xanthoceras sorbifolium]